MQIRCRTAAGEVTLEVDPTQVAVRFREPAPRALRKCVAEQTPNLVAGSGEYELPGERYTVFSVSADGPDPEKGLREAEESLMGEESVARVARVFRADDHWLVATDRVVVGFGRDAPGPIHQLEQLGFAVVDQRDTEYLVQLREDEDPLDIITTHLADLPGLVFAEPDFVEWVDVPEPGPKQLPGPTDPDDEHAASQWARPRTGADEAMEELDDGKGDPSIRIAILDAGVDREHDDLAPVIAITCDASDESTGQNPLSHDWHGTACAGLAAAAPFNEIGIRGFGGGCSIVAVRIFYSTGQPRRWKVSSYAVKRGIDLAVDNGADVLSMSWVLSCPWTCVVNAMERAARDGRGGKGCVLVAGTGNDTGAPRGVRFPARHPEVLAIAATDTLDRPVDRQWSGTSWSSAGGPEVDLAAPGISHVTTDNRGTAGDEGNPSPSGDYTWRFDRTSSSTAIVAGAAGLVLSAKPGLTGAQVREILRSTAKKVNTVRYDTNGHNDRLGRGLLDLLEAVKKALVS